MALSKDKISSHAGVFEPREVHVPRWADESGDDVVLVRGMAAREWDTHQLRVERSRAKNGSASNVTAELLVRCILNPDGSRMFNDAEASLVGELPIGELNVLGKAVLDESGLTDEAQVEIEGNSEAAESGNSPSDSPTTSSQEPETS